MKDIISVNRQFLILAREEAISKSPEVAYDAITGLSASMLSRISKLSLDEIEELAKSEIGLFTLRLTEKQLDALVTDMREKKRTAYLVAASLP